MTRKFLAITMVLSIGLTAAAGLAFGDEYKLGVSDRFRVKVQEWPDLSREYTVTAGGSASLPLVGNVGAAGRRVQDLAQEISDRLQRRADGSQRPWTAVEIIQFRPFSIVGDVQRR